MTVNFPGLPDPPIKVELCDWDVDHMDLQWGFPPSDGGAPILHYKVEMRNIKDAEDKWTEVGIIINFNNPHHHRHRPRNLCKNIVFRLATPRDQRSSSRLLA